PGPGADGPSAARGARLRRASFVVAVLLAVGGVLASAGSASAASYRYWSFWSGAADGGWAYQQQGPNTYVPPDGSVDGWRFG
ncbi:hypothetical protein ACFP3V_03545, partial [Streptacidiphilus monticola]